MALMGIETSCDETAVGIVDADGILLANAVFSQMELHAQYGGVIPELAARRHILTIEAVAREALATARLDWSDIDAVAVTNGPGLAGALLIGVSVAKALALTLAVPLIGVNHIEGHIAAALLQTADNPAAADLRDRKGPFACLVVSGGHTEIIIWDGVARFEIVGRTRDDAVGEAFDKVARALGLSYPGGPAIQAVSQGADERRFALPRPLLGVGYDFSFSGLKTAAIRQAQKLQSSDAAARADLAAAFQLAACETLVSKTLAAASEYDCAAILAVGGVAANARLRAMLAAAAPVPVFIPPPRLCTDNGAMIAMRGLMLRRAARFDQMDLDVYPNLTVGAAVD